MYCDNEDDDDDNDGNGDGDGDGDDGGTETPFDPESIVEDPTQFPRTVISG